MFAIQAREITKIFRIYDTPQDRLKELLFRKKLHREFIALKDITLDVPKGETLGIIGDNGAGKSTMLKILAGTLSATSGQLDIQGRVAALLELGAGFHPDFTGRQNIFMNGALLGLSEQELNEKQQAIIEFSELENFIDQPVKTYSSGMYVRLAFSIATSVDPDILIIDEALSVGDQRFQKKCIDRMMNFRESGKTIIFCSHSMYHINQLCEHAIWIHHGKIFKQGKSVQISAAYEDYCTARTQEPKENQETPQPHTAPPVHIKKIILNESGQGTELDTGDDLEIAIQYESDSTTPFIIAIGIKRSDELILNAVSMTQDNLPPLSGAKSGTARIKYPKIPLLHGTYYAVVMLLDEYGLHVYDQKVSPAISVRPEAEWKPELGIIRLSHQWQL